MGELAHHRLGEALDRVLGPAIGRLQRDRPVGHRRADVDNDPAVPRPHPLQRGHRAVYLPVVGHLGHPAELRHRRVPGERQRPGEGHVHPHADLAQLRFHRRRGLPDGVVVGDVHRHGQRLLARLAHVRRSSFQARRAPGQDRDVIATAGELTYGSAPDATGAAGDDRHLLPVMENHSSLLLLCLSTACCCVSVRLAGYPAGPAPAHHRCLPTSLMRSLGAGELVGGHEKGQVG